VKDWSDEIVSRRQAADNYHKETTTVTDLMKELSEIRKEVTHEYQWFQGFGQEVHDRESIILAKRKRLLFLFVKDLATGVSGETLSNKSLRDASVVSSRTRMLQDGVPFFQFVVTWIFVALLNVGLLFYVYLFAINQTHSRQSAWFHSFLMWLVFEVFVSSTGLVILTHLLIPLYVLVNVSKIKVKVLNDLILFREEYLRRRSRDLEEGRIIDSKINGTVKTTDDFNAAKYLFTSWRVASLISDLPESKLIVMFRTHWPKKKFGEKEDEVATEYEQAVILTALSRIFLYFLGSLLRFHTLVQDIIIQTLCNSGLGFLSVWMIALFAIHPALPVAVVVIMLLVLGYLVRVLGRTNKIGESLAAVAPTSPIDLHPVVTQDASQDPRPLLPVVGPIETVDLSQQACTQKTAITENDQDKNDEVIIKNSDSSDQSDENNEKSDLFSISSDESSDESESE
jgi:hypothetical protein